MLSLLDLIQMPGQDIDPGLDNVRAVGEDDEDLDEGPPVFACPYRTFP